MLGSEGREGIRKVGMDRGEKQHEVVLVIMSHVSVNRQRERERERTAMCNGVVTPNVNFLPHTGL